MNSLGGEGGYCTCPKVLLKVPFRRIESKERTGGRDFIEICIEISN